MKRPWQITFLMVILSLLAGCESVPHAKPIDPAKVLQRPYQLRLSLDRSMAAPGELVYATIEFENTGSDTLWIPRRREVFFGFEQSSSSASLESWSSSCDGLEFVAVKPGRKVRYEKAFVAPDLLGELSVYITADRKVSVPIFIKAKEPKQSG